MKSSLAAASALLVEGWGGDEAAHCVSIDYGRRKHVYRPLDCAAFTRACEAMIFPELHALSEPPSEGAAEADPKPIQCGRDGWAQMPLAELQSQRSHDCQKEFASILCGCAAAQQRGFASRRRDLDLHVTHSVSAINSLSDFTFLPCTSVQEYLWRVGGLNKLL